MMICRLLSLLKCLLLCLSSKNSKTRSHCAGRSTIHLLLTSLSSHHSFSALFSLYSTIHLLLTSLSSHHSFSLHSSHYIQPYTCCSHRCPHITPSHCTLLTIFNHTLDAHIAVLTSLLLTALYSLYSTLHLLLTSLSSHHPFSLHSSHYIQPYTCCSHRCPHITAAHCTLFTIFLLAALSSLCSSSQ